MNYIDFTAIDFETSSGCRNSVYQVGVVRVERGVIDSASLNACYTAHCTRAACLARHEAN